MLINAIHAPLATGNYKRRSGCSLHTGSQRERERERQDTTRTEHTAHVPTDPGRRGNPGTSRDTIIIHE